MNETIDISSLTNGTIKVYFDGACGPTNPNGHIGFGFYIKQDGKILYEYSECIMLGEKGFTQTSNNVSEYLALTAALKWLILNRLNFMWVRCYGDSQLVIRQMDGQYGINGGIYIPYALKCKEVASMFKKIDYHWIPREENTYADDLSKKAMTERGVKEFTFTKRNKYSR